MSFTANSSGQETGESPLKISDAQKEQYREEGYFILEAALDDAQLAHIRGECDRLTAEEEAKMDQAEVAAKGITHKGRRLFISNRHRDNPGLRPFIFSELMAEICRATLGDTAFLFHEQFVVKGPEVGMKFGWHQDSGYVGFDHRPYLSCWAALDDVSDENGTVYILPFSRAGTRHRLEHTVEAGSNDKIGYFGDDPGVPVVAPAGSIAVFSSVSFHRSSPNTSDGWRRVYLTQYSAEPIYTEDGSRIWSNAEPFIEDGERITTE